MRDLNFLRPFSESIGSLGLALALCSMLAACSSSPSPQIGFSDFAQLDAGVHSLAATADCDERCQKLRQEFRYVVYVGKEIYCYWDEKKVESGSLLGSDGGDGLARKLEAAILTTTSDSEYYLTLRTWASAFHDGHVNVLLKDDHSGIDIYTAPVRLQIFAADTNHEKVLVTSVGDALNGVDVKAGDEVTAINSVPIAQALDQAETQVSGSTRRMRRYFGSRRLIDALGVTQGSQPLTLSLLRSGKTTQVELSRQLDISAKPDLDISDANVKPPTGTEQIKAMILPSGIGYLRINGFSGSQDQSLLAAAMHRLSQTKGLLIDVRENGGGDQSGSAIIAKLIKTSVVRYRTSERLSDYLLASRPEIYEFWKAGAAFADWHDIVVKPDSNSTDSYIGKPVMALTSPNCFSACDTFIAGLRANDLATIAGEDTGGGTGTPLVFQLPYSGNRFRYGVVRGMTAKGIPIEGNGTAPDLRIEADLKDVGTRKDSQLEAALQALQQKANLPHPMTGKTLHSSLVISNFGLTGQQSISISPTLEEEIQLKSVWPSDESMSMGL
jgi:carboxyl-terminal processing protease